MSKKEFIEAYTNANLKALKKFIRKPKSIPINKFVTYLEDSFISNRAMYEILVLILFNQYNLNKIISNVIDRDNIDLLENILSHEMDVKLDENLILKTTARGRISMAKAIYEYIHRKSAFNTNSNSDSDSDSDSNSDSDSESATKSDMIVLDLIQNYDFDYDPTEDSIDSFILALSEENCEHANQIISQIIPNFWNNFAIKYAVAMENICVVKKLLLHNAVDPGTDSNAPLIIALQTGSYDIANELLKHPLVTIDEVDLNSIFICYLIEHNYACVAEKIFNLADKHTLNLFKTPLMTAILIESNNDITYIALKMGLIKTNNLKIKNNLKKYKLAPYVNKPYELQLDPNEVIKRAIKHNDMNLAKSIINYSISINPFLLFCYLIGYKDIDLNDTESVCDYIWNNVLQQYDPNELLITALKIDRSMAIHRASLVLDRVTFTNNSSAVEMLNTKYDTPIAGRIIDIVSNNPELDWDYVYDENDADRTEVWDTLKEMTDATQCKMFIEYLIDEDLISQPLSRNFDELDEEDQFDELNDSFDKFIY